MNVIEKWFLRAKHWQIFCILIGIGIVGDLLAMSSISIDEHSLSHLDTASLLNIGLAALVLSFFLGWYWSMGSFLDSIVKPTLSLRKGFFRFALIFPPIYLSVFFAMLELRNPVLFAMILPLHFLAMFCLFYGLYFVSKNLVMVESGKPSTFYDYAGPFF